MCFGTLQRSTGFPSALHSEICICSRNIDILGYNGEQGFVIWTDSASRRFLYSLWVFLSNFLLWTGPGPLPCSPALRKTCYNFNFFAQFLSFSLSLEDGERRGTHWHGREKTQSYLPSCEELRSPSVCLTGKTGQFPSPQGTLILTGLHGAVPCDCSGSAVAFHINWAALLS